MMPKQKIGSATALREASDPVETGSPDSAATEPHSAPEVPVGSAAAAPEAAAAAGVCSYFQIKLIFH